MPNTDQRTGRARARAEDRPGAVDVTVVMPVRNEAAHIEAVLDDVLTQTLGDLTLEVLVVDGQSNDDTVARVTRVAERDARVRVLDNPRRLSSAARKIGAEAARGRYVAYVDGHCRIPSETMLADMVALFEKTGADCLARPQPLVPEDAGWTARAIAAARTSPFGHSVKSTIYDDDEHEVSPVSAGAMYRRDVFDDVGSFDPAFDACEDVEFNYRVERAGRTAWTSPKLAVAYEPRRSLSALFEQMARYGLGRARLHRKHPQAFTFESLIPAGFVLGLPVLLLALVLRFPGWPLVAAPYALYALLALGFSIATAARRGWSLLPLIPLAFFTIHVGLGVGYLRGWLTPMPRADDSEGDA